MAAAQNQVIPPHAGPQPRRLNVSARQLLGLVLLALLPLAALLGLTSRQGQLQVTAGDLHTSMSWPLVTRLYRPGLLELEVRASGELNDVQVALPLEFLSGFSDFSSEPGAEQLADGSYLIGLGDMSAGQTRNVRIELRPISGQLLRTVISVGHAAGVAELAISQLTLP